MSETATGGCLCGGVRYKITGKLRDVVECHCAMCRRIAWPCRCLYRRRQDRPRADRRQCAQMVPLVATRRAAASAGPAAARCSGIPLQKDYIAVAAGTLDPPTGLKTALQIHVADAGDYYTIRGDVPQRSGGSGGG